MALTNGKPNPLNYFKLRRVDFAAPHFNYTTTKPTGQIELLDQWIYQNLNNRYYIGQGITVDTSNSIVYTVQIGFESETDLSFFMIACPYFNTR